MLSAALVPGVGSEKVNSGIPVLLLIVKPVAPSGKATGLKPVFLPSCSISLEDATGDRFMVLAFHVDDLVCLDKRKQYLP